MEYATIAGNFYTITSKDGCTVTDATGTLNMTVDAGGQLTVQAPSDKLVYDDEQAIVFKVNFKSALAALGLLGGGDKLPAGYTRAEYLESTGSQYIDTGVMPTGDTKVSVDVMATAFSYTNYVFGSEHADGPNMLFSLSYAGANANSGMYRYDSQLAEIAYGFHSVNVRYFYEFDRNVAYLDGVFRPFRYNKIIELVDFVGTKSLLLFASRHENNNGITPSGSKRIWSFKIEQSGKRVLDFIPALTPAGEPCMFDTVTREPYRNAGSGQFIAGMTLAQVRGLRLPAGGGELTLALPHEASIDRLAQAALERARAKGWELTLQYAEAEVPAGYRRLEFLESTGTQYIDTGVNLSSESRVICEFFALRTDTRMIFGARQAYGAAAFCSSVGSEYVPSYGNSTAVVARGVTDGKLDANKNEWTLNNYVTTFEKMSFETPVSALLFSVQQSGTIDTRYFIGRIYSFSISRAGEMQVDYVPCIAPNGMLGMYNRVDGTVKENAGSGAFIAGLATVDDVRKLWLPETSGELTVSVPADTPDSAVEQLRKNNPTWQIAIQYRTDNEN